MKIVAMALMLACALPASTILPGSWIETPSGGSGSSMGLNIQADDGFFIVGGGEAEVWTHNGIVDLEWQASSSGAWVTSVSPPWVPGDGTSTAADTAWFIMSAPDTPLTAGSAPFTFYGSLEASGQTLGSPVYPLFYEFAGQGTAYFNIDGDGDEAYAQSVRYEFEAVESDVGEIPEPSTWVLLLLGLGAANWIGKRRQAGS